MKKVLTMHDISCVGKCSLTVALPVLSCVGIECNCLPTALLSTHTGGFTDYTFLDLENESKKIYNHFKQLDLKFDALYSGYLGSIEQINLLSNIINDLKKYNTKIIIDPVMGDNGQLYKGIADDFVNYMKQIVTKADIIIPNITEACFLLNKKYKEFFSIKELKSILVKLSDLGPSIVVLTGIYVNGKYGSISYNKSDNKFYKYYLEKIPGYYHGTGDLFSSGFVGSYINGLSVSQSIKNASKLTYFSIKKTYEDNLDTKFGVEFEYFLNKYSKEVKKKMIKNEKN